MYKVKHLRFDLIIVAAVIGLSSSFLTTWPVATAAPGNTAAAR